MKLLNVGGVKFALHFLRHQVGLVLGRVDFIGSIVGIPPPPPHLPHAPFVFFFLIYASKF